MLLAFLCLPSWGADEPKKPTKIDLAGGWYYKGQLNFYNEVDNTVYEVTEKGVTPRYKLNLGKN